MNASYAGPDSAPSRGEIVLGLLPFAVLGALVALMEAPRTLIQWTGLDTSIAGLLLGVYLLILAVLALAWVRQFPRWSMPYLGYGLVFTLYMMKVATPGLALFGIPIWGEQGWGLRACAPAGLLVLVGLLFTHPPGKPIARLFRNIWNDWTFLAFGLYGFLPLILLILQDEMDHAYSFAPTLIAVGIMLAGAALHLIFAHKPYRVAFLLGGMFLSVLVVLIGSNMYWKTHDVSMETFEVTPLAGPVPWLAVIADSLNGAAMWTLFLALAAIVGLLHAWTSRGSRPRPSE